MSELFDYFKERYSKNKTETQDIMRRVQVKNTLVVMFEEKVKEGDTLFFEVNDRDLEYVLLAVDEEPLRSSYVIDQVGKNMFSVKAVEIDMD